MGRVSRLANSDFAKAVAEAYASGWSRDEMAREFGAHVDTITDWTRDPRVQAHAARYSQERVNRMTRKIDSELDRRLMNLDDENKYPVEIVLKLRKELLDRALKIDMGKAGEHAETINEAASALEENPELARALQEWASTDAKA